MKSSMEGGAASSPQDHKKKGLRIIRRKEEVGKKFLQKRLTKESRRFPEKKDAID